MCHLKAEKNKLNHSGCLLSQILFHCFVCLCICIFFLFYKKVQVGKDQEKAQSEKDSHSKNRGGKKPN